MAKIPTWDEAIWESIWVQAHVEQLESLYKEFLLSGADDVEDFKGYLEECFKNRYKDNDFLTAQRMRRWTTNNVYSVRLPPPLLACAELCSEALAEDHHDAPVSRLIRLGLGSYIKSLNTKYRPTTRQVAARLLEKEEENEI